MEEIKCEICNKKFKTSESLAQHKQASHANEKKVGKINTKKYFILAALIIAVILISYTFYARANKPGAYDDFAKCLTEKGVVIYGNDFCQYTNKQVNMFGNSKKYLNYVKCAENEALCDSKGVDITPTWEINGKMYEQVQGLDKLVLLSGCEI